MSNCFAEGERENLTCENLRKHHINIFLTSFQLVNSGPSSEQMVNGCHCQD